MRAYFVKIVACLLVASGFSAAVAGQVTQAPKTTYRPVTISTQAGATVWLDNLRYGKTDSSGKLAITVPAGAHTIKVRADGFKERTLGLTAVQKGEVNITLGATTDAAELAFQEGERRSGSDRDKAIQAYRKAAKLNPAYIDADLALARGLADNGDLDEALKTVAAARRIRPGLAEASAIEGRIQKDNGEEAKAIAAFKRAIAEGHGVQPEGYAGLGLLYKEKAEGFGAAGDFDNEKLNYNEAAKDLKMALKQLGGAPDAIVIYQLLGLIYERQKRYPEAIAVYEDFLRIFPDTAEATAVRSFIVQIRKDMSAQD